LTFLGNGHQDKHGHYVGLWRCDCGTEKEIVCSRVARGDVVSCGCVSRANTIRRSTKHGCAHRDSLHPLYRIFSSKKNLGLLCPEWLDFPNFKEALESMGWVPPWGKGRRNRMEIHRHGRGQSGKGVPDTGLYAPDNCQVINGYDHAQLVGHQRSLLTTWVRAASEERIEMLRALSPQQRKEAKRDILEAWSTPLAC